MDKNATKLDASDEGSEYEVKTIWNSAVYAKKSELGYLLELYYLVFWKDYLKEENIWKPYSAVQHLRKLISLFYKDYPNKPTAISESIDIALPMSRSTIKLAAKPMIPKQKQG